MNFITRFCATVGAETSFERARLAATYQNTYPPCEEDIKVILQALAGQDQETDRRIAFGSIVRKLRSPTEDWVFGKMIRCVSDGILLKEFCELDLPQVEFRREQQPINKKLLIHELIQYYWVYIKFKSQQLRMSFSLTLYKKEKVLYFNQMGIPQIINEINILLQFQEKAFNVIETNNAGHLRYKLNQYVFGMLLNDLFKYYGCSLIAFNTFLRHLTQLELDEVLKLAEITNKMWGFSEKLESFINNNKFIAGFDCIDLEYKIDKKLVELIIQYVNLFENKQNNTNQEIIEFKTYTSKAIFEEICKTIKIFLVNDQLSENQSTILGSIQIKQPSKLEYFVNSFKQNFQEDQFIIFQNNYSTSYKQISQNNKTQKMQTIQEEQNPLEIIEAQQQQLEINENILFDYPNAYDESIFAQFENIFHK